AFQELSNGGSTARHSFRETPIVDRRQFLIRQHDLKAFAARQPCHHPVLRLGCDGAFLVSRSKRVKGYLTTFYASYSFFSKGV
ncbi:hypothetical protein, partial [Roseiarcus sp.]|uniref:hypothetical protein n=1 Tax=Roseiarcus sp. TaxID=1969460 RepID=UPI003C56FE92